MPNQLLLILTLLFGCLSCNNKSKNFILNNIDCVQSFEFSIEHNDLKGIYFKRLISSDSFKIYSSDWIYEGKYISKSIYLNSNETDSLLSLIKDITNNLEKSQESDSKFYLNNVEITLNLNSESKRIKFKFKKNSAISARVNNLVNFLNSKIKRAGLSVSFFEPI